MTYIPRKEFPRHVDAKLLACPGCKSTLGPYLSRSMPIDAEAVVCTTCGMQGPYNTMHADAVQRWNDLPRDPVHLEEDHMPETIACT